MRHMLVHFEDTDYQFELEDIDVSQARYIKRQTGLSIKAFLDGLGEIDPDCVVAAYWLMKAQNGTVVDMNKVNFKLIRFGDALGEAMKAEDEAENPTGEPVEALPQKTSE